MKSIQKRLGSLFMAAVMLLSMAVTPAMAVEKKEPPTVTKIEGISMIPPIEPPDVRTPKKITPIPPTMAISDAISIKSFLPQTHQTFLL